MSSNILLNDTGRPMAESCKPSSSRPTAPRSTRASRPMTLRKSIRNGPKADGRSKKVKYHGIEVTGPHGMREGTEEDWDNGEPSRVFARSKEDPFDGKKQWCYQGHEISNFASFCFQCENGIKWQYSRCKAENHWAPNQTVECIPCRERAVAGWQLEHPRDPRWLQMLQQYYEDEEDRKVAESKKIHGNGLGEEHLRA